MSTHCRECRLPVETYAPTGAPMQRRAIRHPQSAYAVGGCQCPGSFTPVDSADDVERDAERTQRWRRADGGPSLREYLQSRGEL